MRVERSLAFVDLCGFTAFAERHGDEKAVLILAELRSALRETAARRGVRIAKWLGDGAMLSSTSTQTLVSMTMEIERRLSRTIPALAVRAGLDRGPVVMYEGDDYIGRAVNLASRLCDAAEPHQVLSTSAVAAALPPWVLADGPARVGVPSFTDPILAFELQTAPAEGDASSTDPVCGLVIPAMAGVPDHDTATTFCSVECADAWRHATVGPTTV